MDSPSLASLSLTHVHYDPADPISHACAYLALVPQALVITYVALIWSTREVEILLMFAGQMGCEAFNWLLKRTIKEQRPPRAYIRIHIHFHAHPQTGQVICSAEADGKAVQRCTAKDMACPRLTPSSWHSFLPS